MQRFNRYKAMLFLAVTFVLIAPGFLYGQSAAGAITGTVVDPNGALVPGAKVTVTNQATNVSRSMTVTNAGLYSFEGLNVGKYSIDVSQSGFEEYLVQGIQIDPGQRRGINIALKIGANSVKVTVEAYAVEINTESSESSGTISANQIENLQMNGRNFQSLAVAIPGVANTNAADSQSGLGGSLIVSGTGVDESIYTLDGVYDENSGNYAGVDLNPIVDGISEFSVVKNNYSAKYGFAGSGQINVVTKSGTDTFHGSAWEYARNNDLDATPDIPGTKTKTAEAAYHHNIYGYTLGGPLYIPKVFNTDRKKTFFFAANQWTVQNGSGIGRGAVFTQAQRGGDFSNSPTLPAGGLNLDAHSQMLLAGRGLNPASCVTSSTTLNPVCFDPIAVAYMTYPAGKPFFPLPNNPTGGFLNYINLASNSFKETDYQYRVDHYITPNEELSVRVLYMDNPQKFTGNIFNGVPFASLNTTSQTPGANLLLRLQSTITPNLLNVFSMAETKDYVRYGIPSGTNILLPGGVTVTEAFPNAPHQGWIPDVSFASGGYTGNGMSISPITASDGEGMVFDDLSWLRGKHDLQFGAIYMFGIKRQDNFTRPQGSFTFGNNGTHTGDVAADFMLGLDTNYYQDATRRHGNFHYRQGEFYLQDDVKVNPRLTLNLGVRWQYFSNDTLSGDAVDSFSPLAFNPAEAPVVNLDGSFEFNAQNQALTSSGQVANLLNGMLFAGQPGVRHGFFTPKKTNIGPRVGFAYKAWENTSIRGGYGIGYSRVPLAQLYYAAINPPFVGNANYLNTLLSNGIAGSSALNTASPQNLENIPFKFTPTQMQTYSLTVERQIIPAMVAAVGYAGVQGRHLAMGAGQPTGFDGNFPTAVLAPSQSGCLASGQAVSASYDFDPCINTGATSPNYTRPYQGWATMNNVFDQGSSNYNALQAALSYRAHGSQVSLAYTWSKDLADVGPRSSGGYLTSQLGVVQNPRNIKAEYGPVSFDFPHDFAATWVYDIPYFKKSAKPIAETLGNWEFAGLFLYQSGQALTPTMATSTNGLATRPNEIKPVHLVKKVSEWFDPSSFAAPDYGFFGNSHTGVIRAPSYTGLNVSVLKNFPIIERLSTQFRAEAFNVLNHPNLNAPDTGLGSPTEGVITSTREQRILELALRVTF